METNNVGQIEIPALVYKIEINCWVCKEFVFLARPDDSQNVTIYNIFRVEKIGIGNQFMSKCQKEVLILKNSVICLIDDAENKGYDQGYTKKEPRSSKKTFSVAWTHSSLLKLVIVFL